MNSQVLSYDPVKFTMTVGTGMRINQLLPEATRHNMSVMVRSGKSRREPDSWSFTHPHAESSGSAVATFRHLPPLRFTPTHPTTILVVAAV